MRSFRSTILYQSILLSLVNVPSIQVYAMVAALNVRFQLEDGQRNAFLDAIKEDQEHTLSDEANALQFVVGQDVDNPNIIYLHEQYVSQSDLDHHNETPHFKKFIQFVQSNGISDPVLDRFNCLHKPSGKISLRPAFCLNVESCVKPEVRDKFTALMKRHQQLSLAEPGCLQFDWGVDAEDPNTFYIHEEYQSKKDYDDHEMTFHFDTFMKFNSAKQPYSKPQVVGFYTQLA